MRSACVTLFVVVVVLGVNACLGDDFFEYDDDYPYGMSGGAGYMMGYPQQGGVVYGGGYGGGYGKGYGGGYGGGYGKGYGRVESTVVRTPYVAPMYLPPPPAVAAGGLGGFGGDGGLFGVNNGLIFLLFLLPFLLSTNGGGLLG